MEICKVCKVEKENGDYCELSFVCDDCQQALFKDNSCTSLDDFTVCEDCGNIISVEEMVEIGPDGICKDCFCKDLADNVKILTKALAGLNSFKEASAIFNHDKEKKLIIIDYVDVTVSDKLEILFISIYDKNGCDVYHGHLDYFFRDYLKKDDELQ